MTSPKPHAPQPVTWYLATCQDCQQLTMPFLTKAKREEWTRSHVLGARHKVRYMTEIGPPPYWPA